MKKETYGLSQHIQRHGEAMSQYQQAYDGNRYDTKGNEIKHLGRNLKKISQYKLNSKNPTVSIKQQAGFSAELAKEAQDNQLNILNNSKVRVRTTDGIGMINHQQADHVSIQNGKTLDNSASQMKFLENHKQTVDKLALDPKWRKYREVNVDIPKEQYSEALNYCAQKISELQNSLKHAQKNQNYTKMKKCETDIKNYKETAEILRDSGVTMKEAIEARKNPEVYVAKKLVNSAHEAGKSAVKETFILNTTVAIAQNTYLVVFNNQNFAKAVENVTQKTMNSNIDTYSTVALGSLIKSTMHSSKKEAMRRVGKTQAPMLIASGSVETGKTLTKYALGELNEQEAIKEISETGMSMAVSGFGSSFGATVGTMILPGLGTLTGGYVGNMLAYTIYKIIADQTKIILNDYKLSIVRKKEIQMLSQLANEELKRYEKDLRELALKRDRQTKKIFDDFFKVINSKIDEQTVDDFFRAIQMLGNNFGCKIQFENFTEFDQFMNDEKTVLKL
ncbi:MAG: hypothetical protein ACRDD4_00460 [Culicoidibacterales bacterium]